MMPQPPPNCRLCDEPITNDDHPVVMGIYAHSECMVREVMGGIGHHMDHNFWCKQMHDPDAGRTYRQSALEVADLVREKGIFWIADDD